MILSVTHQAPTPRMMMLLGNVICLAIAKRPCGIHRAVLFANAAAIADSNAAVESALPVGSPPKSTKLTTAAAPFLRLLDDGIGGGIGNGFAIK